MEFLSWIVWALLIMGGLGSLIGAVAMWNACGDEPDEHEELTR